MLHDGGCRMKLDPKMPLVRLLACVLCFFLLLLTAVVLWPRPDVNGIAITFVMFTNAPGQPPSAVFSVTNRGPERISFVIPEPQIRSEGVWSEIVVPGRPALELADGNGTNVTIALPTHGDAYRMPIVWCYRPSLPKLYFRRTQNLIYNTAKRGSLAGWKYGFVLTTYTNFSSELSRLPQEPASHERSF